MLRRILSAAGISLAAILISASPAHAGTDIPPTYSPDMGAGGRFTSNGDIFRVCDLKLDGLRARMYMWRSDAPHYLPGISNVYLGHVDDTTADGSCVDKGINIPESYEVTFKICTFRASDRKPISCRYSPPGVA
ncbi:hypothetical protein [Actinomadura sp. 3N407]|uniref:hypothetical protein n=1 Tax=Actinomadura sp. 3N407 TaxID=3457423 RepID=UPI003FCD877B